MPIHFACPNGHALVAQEKQVGRIMRCPKCQAQAQVPHADGQPAASAKPDRPVGKPARATPKPRREQLSGDEVDHRKLARVRLGLGFHCLRLMAFLATPALLVMGGAASARVSSAFVGVILIALLLLLSPILGMIGSILCANIPKKKAQTLILTSFGLDLAGFGLGIVKTIVVLGHFLSAEGVTSFAIEAAQFGLSLASWLAFMFFLRRLANFLEEWGQANDAYSLIKFGGVLVVPPYILLRGALVAIQILDPEHVAEAMDVIVGVIGALGLLWLVFLFRFLLAVLAILRYLRKTIAKQLEQNS